jgi:hypothetical protein
LQALNDPAALYGWRRVMQQHQVNLYGEHDRYLQQRTNQANLDAARRTFIGMAEQSIRAGEGDPAKIHQRMQTEFARVSQLHRLTPDQTNAAIFSAARSIAEQGIPGDPMLGVSIVREMLLGKRGDLPPLGQSNQYAHLTNQVIELAERQAGELQRKLANETVYQPARTQ